MTDKTVYVSSKLKHRDKWIESGIETISSWICGEELPPDECSAMWDRYKREVVLSDSFILYVEPEDQLKGCMLELGMAFSYCDQIIIIWSGDMASLVSKIGTIVYHDIVQVVPSIADAKELLFQE